MGVLWMTRRYKCRAEQKAAIYTESRSGDWKHCAGRLSTSKWKLEPHTNAVPRP